MAGEKHSWWLELRHGGMLISPALLEEIFPMDFDKPDDYSVKRLREKYSRFDTWFQNERRSETQLKQAHEWIEYVLESFLKMNYGRWLKGSEVNEEHSLTTIIKERIKPNRVFYRNVNDKDPLLVIFVDGSKRLGVGKSRKTYGNALQYLRAMNIKLGLITNGAQFRLCYAGLDHESWVEWDASDWFESSEYSHRLYGFYTLLGPAGLSPRDGIDIPLKKAIEESRSRQGELSGVLGEQVRQAIELLVEEFNHTREKEPEFISVIKNPPQGSELNDELVLGAVFQAAVRVIMRMVVILFAEARDLLPKSNEKYNSNYGIEGLFENLRHARSAETEDFMDDSHSEWLRLLALFRLIYLGSPHPDLQMPRYGGELFAPGDIHSDDPVKRALALFEDARLEVSNSVLLSILEKLKFGRLKIKKGRSTAFVKGPVNFGELRTEYIGMIYEGILNYGLRSANETMLLINSGLEPILPLSVLETLSDSQLREMFDKLSKKDEAGEEEPQDKPEEESAEEIFEDDTVVREDDAITYTGEAVELAMQWAEKAVVAIGWVKKTKRKIDEYEFRNIDGRKARSLVKKVYSPGEFYLSLWGGTRKGTGTFYTKPQLAVPTVRRTLEPLAYHITAAGEKSPKLPEEILSVKVCDTSCGSASFLVAAIHYLTDALYESLVVHASINRVSDYKRKTLPFGLEVESASPDSFLPCSPDEEGFEERVKVRLRRYVVEHCIYGVDLNPMAVELARLSLWIETMDKDLPFEFLDHKIKTGNSLVGARLDTFQEYPLAAWLREGGDRSHPSSVNHKEGTWTKSIKDKFQNVIKPEMVQLIKRRSGQLSFSFAGETVKPAEAHSELFLSYVSMHDQSSSFFGLENKEKIYNEGILKNPHYLRLKEAMDMWCAVWFWPADQLDSAPTPLTFYSPGAETISVAREVAAHHRFFHWEIEFPDVFNKGRSGFDAVLGNPPWDTLQPNSKEFFSKYDPMYRALGKQDALRKQGQLFEASEEIELEWLNYLDGYKSLGNYIKEVAAPFGVYESSNSKPISLERNYKSSEFLHGKWKEQRKSGEKGFILSRPFVYNEGGKLYTYKLFTELSYHLLKRNGRLGYIIPSGIYSDDGSKRLRSEFLENSNWEWLFSFENKQAIFDIHRSFKFNPIIVSKGGTTQTIKTAFMRHNVADWENPEIYIDYPLESIKKFSPFNLSLLEINERKEADIIEKIFNNAILLGDKSPHGWGLTYAQGDFNMTSDSNLFHNRNKLLEKGYIQDNYGRLISPNGDVMLPLYQGVMIWQYDFSAAGYVKGAGNRAEWREIDQSNKVIESQFYISTKDYPFPGNTKLVIRAIQNATNQRTLIAAVLPPFPCGNSLAVLFSYNLFRNLLLVPFLNSFQLDMIIRKRMSQNNINSFLVEEMPVPLKERISKHINALVRISASLNLHSNIYAIQNLQLKNFGFHYKRDWALTPAHRMEKICALDAITADLYNLNYKDFEFLLSDDSKNQKGFWRVDKDKPVELRQTTLALQAFKRLKEVGIEEFINEDWQLPPDVQQALGPRFYDWQLQGTPEESWAECEYHARQILGEEGFAKFMRELDHPEENKNMIVNEPAARYGKKNKPGSDQMNLF